MPTDSGSRKRLSRQEVDAAFARMGVQERRGRLEREVRKVRAILRRRRARLVFLGIAISMTLNVAAISVLFYLVLDLRSQTRGLNRQSSGSNYRIEEQQREIDRLQDCVSPFSSGRC